VVVTVIRDSMPREAVSDEERPFFLDRDAGESVSNQPVTWWRMA
jgi:hypothetical protein